MAGWLLQTRCLLSLNRAEDVIKMSLCLDIRNESQLNFPLLYFLSELKNNKFPSGKTQQQDSLIRDKKNVQIPLQAFFCVEFVFVLNDDSAGAG